MEKTLYIVFSNRPAGEMWISSVEYDSEWTYKQLGGCNSTNEFESFSYEECVNYINECRENSKEYLVMWDEYNDIEWIEIWDCCMGTYRELEDSVKGIILRKFKKKEDALKYIKEHI